MLSPLLDGRALSWTQGVLLGALPFTGTAVRMDDGTVIWFDPPEAAGDEAELLAFGKPAHILLTFRDHDRAVARYAALTGAQVWQPKGQGGSVSPVHHEFDSSSELPCGLKALDLTACGYGEHAILGEVGGKRFAAIGDAFFRLDRGLLSGLLKGVGFKEAKPGAPLLMKRSYRGGRTAEVPAQVRQLMGRGLDALLLSHGHAVAEGAEAALAASIA